MGIGSKRISLDEYAQFCQHADVAPSYQPNFVEYYFGALTRSPEIIGKYDRDGRLIAAFPSWRRQVFPNSVHKRLMSGSIRRLGDIGQPEILFPVVSPNEPVALGHLSPTTSPLLSSSVRGVSKPSLRGIAIAKERRHKKLTLRKKSFLESGGEVVYTDALDAGEFAELYVRLYCQRWNQAPEEQRYVRYQIQHLYANVFGTVLFSSGEPVAAQLCFSAVGKNLLYIDFINSGVKIQKDNTISYGSIMMLASLRRAEAMAAERGKKLRYSFGYDFGPNDYKAVWADPEPTFIGY